MTIRVSSLVTAHEIINTITFTDNLMDAAPFTEEELKKIDEISLT